MRIKGIVIALLAIVSILSSCAPRLREARKETCPVAMKADFSVKKKVRYKTKRKPTPSLIHVTRVNYKRDKNFDY
jgi:hypothetical protein